VSDVWSDRTRMGSARYPKAGDVLGTIRVGRQPTALLVDKTVLTAVLGWWWADPLSGLVIVY
jgi:hypothetical protein